MSKQTTKRPVAVVSGMVVAALALAALAATASAAIRHVDGTVLSKDASARTFRVSTESGAKVRFRVNSATEFERIAGFSALRRGMRIEVDYVTTDSGPLARQVETQGGGGDDGGGDDHGGHGGDDGPGHD
jgi:hypothetical protein